MDEILGIVNDDALETDAVLVLIREHVLVNPIETVGFRGWPIVGAERETNVAVFGFEPAYDVRGRLVVRVNAQKEAVAAVRDGGRVVLDHSRNNRVLAPERH